jgi:hypothetical protein
LIASISKGQVDPRQACQCQQTDYRCGSRRDFHESILDKLRCPRHGIRVDLDARKQIRVPPVVDPCGCAAEFNLHAAILEVSDEILVRIACGYVAVGIVGAIVQCHVAGVRVKDRCDLGLGVPVGNVILDEAKVENQAGRSPSNSKAPILNANFTPVSLTSMLI